MKEEEARVSGDTPMAGARKRVNYKFFDEWESSVKGKWALSSLIYVDKDAEFPADFTEAGTKAQHAAREE